jgi:hypothetical protein
MLEVTVLGTPLTEHGDAQSGQLSGGLQTTLAGRSRSISRLFVTHFGSRNRDAVIASAPVPDHLIAWFC